MTSTARRRWLGYAAAALLTIAAMAWVEKNDDSGAAVLATARIATPAVARMTTAARTPSGVPADAPWLRAREDNEPLADPFGTADEGVATSARAAPVAQVPAPVAPQAPPLPFSYVGRWTEHGKTTIYLQGKDRAVAVLGLGRLDDAYTVQSISDQGIVFRYTPLGTLQGLRFDTPPAVATAAAAAATAARPAAPPGPPVAVAAQSAPSPAGDGAEPPQLEN